MQYHYSYTSFTFKMTERIFYNFPERGFVSERVMTWSITIISLQPNSPEEELFLQKALLSFQYLLAPLNEQNWKKTSLELIQSYKHLLCSRPNWKQNGSFIPNKNFFRKTNNIAFVYSSPQINLGADLQLQESVTFGPNSPQNDPLGQNQNFSR